MGSDVFVKDQIGQPPLRCRGRNLRLVLGEAGGLCVDLGVVALLYSGNSSQKAVAEVRMPETLSTLRSQAKCVRASCRHLAGLLFPDRQCRA
jgi:hypothetical protein